MRGSAVLSVAILFGGLLTESGCGRKTPVRPPELVAPEPISTLAATNAVDGVTLTWQRPTQYVDGTRMLDLGAFRVERSDPATPFAPIATIEIADRDRFQQARRFRWLDADAVTGAAYQYRVLSLTTDGYVSDPSNVVSIDRVPPTPAPAPTATPR